MQYSVLRSRVYDDLGLPETGNDLLTAARVNTALAEAYVALAEEANAFSRAASWPLVDEQALYTLPRDLVAIESINYGTDNTDLSLMTKAELADTYGEHWRHNDAGTPSYWYREDARKIGLHPAPDFDGTATTLYVQGWCVPYQVAAISSIQRATNVVTVATVAAHGLTTGDLIRIAKVSTDSFNITSVACTVTSTTGFTYAQTDSNAGPVASSGYVGYGNGVLPLIDDTDEPECDPYYHAAIIGHAVYALASRYLRTDNAAMERAVVGMTDYQERAGRLRQSLLW